MADRNEAPAATPRFSFLMITYNQEKYIVEALNSALAQDYPNLEIVISDDCSSDRTFDIASDIAKNYHGPHKIILHRNEPNLGIGGNFHQAYTLSSGEWLFMAAGDDVFLPNRCRVVAEAIKAHPAALAIASNYEIIDGDGRSLGYNIHPSPLRPGAAIAWQRRVFTEFLPLSRDNKLEDFPLYTRVFLLGGVYVCVSDVLLKYRIDGHSYTGATRNTVQGVTLFRLKNCSTCLQCTQQRLADFHYAQERWPVQHASRLYKRFAWLSEYLAFEKDSLEKSLQNMKGSLGDKVRYLLTPSSLDHQRSFHSRLRRILAASPFLSRLKRRICGEPAVTIVESIPDPPPTGSAETIRLEDYLDDLLCDYTITAYPERFFLEDAGWAQPRAIANRAPKTIRQYRVGQLTIQVKECK